MVDSNGMSTLLSSPILFFPQQNEQFYSFALEKIAGDYILHSHLFSTQFFLYKRLCIGAAIYYQHIQSKQILTQHVYSPITLEV